METGKILLLTAAALAVLGAVLLIVGKLGFGRLPGDILIERDGLTIFHSPWLDAAAQHRRFGPAVSHPAPLTKSA